MNVANMETALAVAVNSAVAAGDLATPRDIPRLVRDLAAVCGGYDSESVQHASDLAQANAIAANVNTRSSLQFR